MDAFIDEGGQRAEGCETAFCDNRGLLPRTCVAVFSRRAALTLTGVPVAKMYEALLRQVVR